MRTGLPRGISSAAGESGGEIAFASGCTDGALYLDR